MFKSSTLTGPPELLRPYWNSFISKPVRSFAWLMLLAGLLSGSSAMGQSAADLYVMPFHATTGSVCANLNSSANVQTTLNAGLGTATWSTGQTCNAFAGVTGGAVAQNTALTSTFTIVFSNPSSVVSISSLSFSAQRSATGPPNVAVTISSTGCSSAKTATVTGSPGNGSFAAVSAAFTGANAFSSCTGPITITMTFTGGTNASGSLRIDDVVVKGSVNAPTINTPTSAGIGNTTATLGGNVAANNGSTVTAYGVVYAASPAVPTYNGTTFSGSHADVTGSVSGAFTSNITGLSSGTAYNYIAYAKNANGTSVTSTGTFTTTAPAVAPAITTPTSASVTTTTATLGGNITSDGNSTITEYGVVYAVSPTVPAVDNAGSVTAGTKSSTTGATSGVFTKGVTGLNSGTLYNYIAYAVNGIGATSTSTGTFTTLAITAPAVSNTSVANLATTSADLGGNITADGNSAITEYGVVYSLATSTPAYDGTVATTGTLVSNSGAHSGTYSNSVTGLAYSTAYKYIAYAKNSFGFTTTSPVTFTTNNPSPSVSSISPDNAEAGSGAFTLTVTGTNFYSGSVVRWNGSDRTTHFGSSTSLRTSHLS
ncbi:MAG: hypothetical protein V4543_16005 [Bacteroidota bacterium]